MLEITANYAARNLAEILEAVEEKGETFTVLRRGRVVAELGPVALVGALVSEPGAAEPAKAQAVVADSVADVIDLRARRPETSSTVDPSAETAPQIKPRRRFFRRHSFWSWHRSDESVLKAG